MKVSRLSMGVTFPVIVEDVVYVWVNGRVLKELMIEGREDRRTYI